VILLEPTTAPRRLMLPPVLSEVLSLISSLERQVA
jgi:hypothetical protein